MKKPEKIDRDEKSPTAKKIHKALAKRYLRRAAKADPQDAPQRTRDITRGYTR